MFDIHKHMRSEKIKKIIKWSLVAVILLVLFEVSSGVKQPDRIKGLACGGVADLQCPNNYVCSAGSCKKPLFR